ncbi:SH3 domain-containing protein [Falsiroseomonas sp.]|uniref:SH3 domain-containing protein n=1 Tax=Falsiroseomonas sp. TaxID=2870721 RepID=UPI002715B8DF|nr:SH3 domain-containing protein [Falsiroseomonas sp.]MDO9501633.1 SH3 domain-containing protein [Falsiroseomonas sp.]
MHKAIPPILAVALLSAGAIGAISLDWGSGPAVTPEVAQPGQASRTPEEAAIAALRAHLGGQGGETLTAIQTYPLEEPGAFAVCARMGGPSGPDVVARVIPALGILPGAGGRQPERDLARSSRSMVVMEDGPGLWRGGAPGLPRQRYCQAVPSAATAPAAGSLAVHVTTPPARSAAEDLAQVPVPVPSPVPAQATATTADPGGAGGSVTVLSPVRVRAAPSGQSEILWVAERGRAFTVHGHAPGGWVQIGDAGAPAGWVHSSLLDSDM